MHSHLQLEKAWEPVSLAQEMGAYEALWDSKGATYKTLAEKFRSGEGLLPSDLVAGDITDAYKRRVLEMIGKQNPLRINVCLHKTSDYPVKLRDARYPIELFYYMGDLDLASSRSVAIVGTRNPTDEGKMRAARLAKLFVRHDYTVVSGLARGIDTIAHWATIEAKGRTVAVIGTPLTETYPKENATLQRLIARDFLIVSSVPFVRYSKQDYRSNRAFFPERNKVMSAFTEATIIVEASDTSGTLVQARAALEQGRKLFILESCFKNKSINWPSKFEKEGAIRIKDFDVFKDHLDF